VSKGLRLSGDIELARIQARLRGAKPRAQHPGPIAGGKAPTLKPDRYHLAALFAQERLPKLYREYQFSSRGWRFDYADPPRKIAIEIEGGIFTQGAHGSIEGALRDIEKYNAATLLGWRILRYLPDHATRAVDDFRQLLMEEQR
jgi:hypothetical protein